MKKAPYKTKQMTELISYMKSVKGKHVTVNDICGHFKSKGIAVGTTTIYRHLDRMVEEGTAAKYIVDGTSSACFEYLGNHEKEASPCYHCKCEKCGRLIHLHCEEIESFKRHMKEHHNFVIDAQRTVFYGVCEECAKEGLE